MILRRFAQALKEQNWTSIAIEFVLLVLGVFLGIQVANWNDDRQQAARQAHYLERLRVDFVGIRDRIQEHFLIYRDAVDGGELLLSIVRMDDAAMRDAKIDDKRMEDGFNALVSSRIPPPLPATYVEMRSEGQLSRIENPVLRDRLAEYDRMTGLLQEAARLTGDNMNLQAPVLARYFVTRTVGEERALSGIREQLISYDIAGMRSDRDFAVAVKMLSRNANNALAVRKRQLALIEEILATLDPESTP